MRQRLALASALVGDPAVLVLDEPFNGLDPAGIATMRSFLRTFADRGGTVFLSSHLLSEVAHSADDAIVIHRGRLVSAGPVSDLSSGSAGVVVTTADADLLAVTLARRGATVERTSPDTLTVTGVHPRGDGARRRRHRRRGHRHTRHRRRPRVRFRRASSTHQEATS